MKKPDPGITNKPKTIKKYFKELLCPFWRASGWKWRTMKKKIVI
jgi:hypothetical protein